jgi:hypothetical protein
MKDEVKDKVREKVKMKQRREAIHCAAKQHDIGLWRPLDSE